MPTLKKVKLASPRRQAKSPWTFDTLNVKPGDIVRWETDGRAKTLFFTDRNLFDGLADLPEGRIIEISSEQISLQVQVKPDAWEGGKTRRIPYAVFHPSEAEQELVRRRGRMIVKRLLPKSSRRGRMIVKRLLPKTSRRGKMIVKRLLPKTAKIGKKGG